MEKVIKIGSQSVRLKSNGLALLTYKRNFGSELIADLFSIYKKGSGGQIDSDNVDIDALNPEAIYNIAYTFAKIADENIGARDEWLEQFDCFPIYDVAEEIIPFVTECITTDAKIKNQLATAGLKQTQRFSKPKKSFWQRRKRV